MFKLNNILREEAEEGSSGGGGLGAGLVPDSTPDSTPEENASADQYQSLLASLPEELQNNATIQNTKSFDALANQLVNAQSALGAKRLEQPQADWTDEKWDEYYTQVRPENNEYSIPEEISISEEFDGVDIPAPTEDQLQELTDFATDMGLNQRQFDGLVGRWAELQMEGNAAVDNHNKETIHKYGADMAEHWGTNFEVNMKQANETFDALSQEIPELQDLVNWSPVVANHPAVLKLFHKISEISGDALPMGNSGSSPFGQNESVQGIKAQIEQLDSDNKQLVMTDPSALSFADREKRENILQKRIKLYSQLYGNS